MEEMYVCVLARYFINYFGVKCISESIIFAMQSPTPLLDIDLEWNLTDFATVGKYTYWIWRRLLIPFASQTLIGSPHISYGRKALDTALTELHGFYRTSAIVWWSKDWNDWRSMATIYNEEKQWPQVELGETMSVFTFIRTSVGTLIKVLYFSFVCFVIWCI